MEGSAMLQDTSLAPAQDAPFHLLGGVNTVAGISHDISKLNIPGNLARGLPKLHQLPGWKVGKGDAPVALIGAGPSLRDTIGELHDFPVTIAAGSCHDWLIEQGHIPTFTVVADPDAVSANYIKRAQAPIQYLIATQCHPRVFDVLEGQDVRTWNLYPCDHAVLDEHDPGWEAVGGGCTVGLRCLSIAIMMGYRNVHFFGFDSCYGEERSHVQDFSEKGEEQFLGETYRISVNTGLNGPSSKIFRCSGYMMAQAQHLKELLCEYGNIIDPTVHGPGLIAEFVRMYKELREKYQAMEAENAASSDEANKG